MITRTTQPNGQPVTIVGIEPEPEPEPEPVDDWADFTERWIAERRRNRKPATFNRLAVAMHNADNGQKKWKTYIPLARQCLSQHYAQ